MANPVLKAPFTYFGGKSKIASAVWERFGDVKHYIEPFFGSGAVLFARPTEAQLETINDKDSNLANAWRAIQREPEKTAEWAHGPVSECDLHARHLWLLNTGQERSDRMMSDPDWCDPQAAGWWIWGMSCWIGGGFCSGTGPWVSDGKQLVKRTDKEGIRKKMPSVSSTGRGIHRKLPHVSDGGVGIHRKMPAIAGSGKGVNRQLPALRNSGIGVHRLLPITEDGTTQLTRNSLRGITAYLSELSERIARVRICCGDWSRVTGPSVLTATGGVCGVFLDPPYTLDSGRDMGVYTHDDGNVGKNVYEWAMAHGDNPKLRIALCGYEGEYDIPDTWETIAWKAAGGYGVQGNGRGRENSSRERVFFSPHCLRSVEEEEQ